MGNPNNWSEPKQNKIARAGEPKGVKRGVLKKGERRKGKKARIDEVLSARNSARQYFEWMERDKKTRQEHPEWYRHTAGSGLRPYEPHYQKWYQREFDRHAKLLEQCILDGVVTTDESKELLI